MTRYIIFTIVLGALLLLPGCATWGGVQQATVVDTYCLSAKKRKWSIDRDAPDRIREARVWNEVVDRRCGISGKS